MGIFDIFSKNNNDLAQYHATAKVLVNHSCDVSVTEELIKKYKIDPEIFDDFHMQKRHLALKTVMFTAAITMEPKKRNMFIDLYQKYIDAHDGVSDMPEDIKPMYKKINATIDNAYLSAFQHVTNSLDEADVEPVKILMESFSELFAALLDRKGDELFIEIGKNIFGRQYKIASHSLGSL